MSKSDNVTDLHEKPPASMPMPGGREQFWNLIAFLNDKKSFEKRMKSLEEATEKHNAAIKLLGGVKKLERSMEKASDLELEAYELLKGAQAEASKLAENNEAEQAKLDKFSGTLGEIKVELTAGLDKLADDRKSLDEYEAGLDKRHEQLATAELKADKATQNANELKGQFEAKLEEHKAMLRALEQEAT